MKIVKNYVCEICGYTYQGKRNELPKHIKKEHGLTYQEYYSEHNPHLR